MYIIMKKIAFENPSLKLSSFCTILYTETVALNNIISVCSFIKALNANMQ